MFATGTEFLPLIVEAPQPPIEPTGRAFKKRGTQPRVPFENAASSEAGDRSHQFHWIADRMRNRVKIRVPDIPRPSIVLQRGITGRMKANRHIEFLQRIP